MSNSQWQPLGAFHRARMHEARLQAHHAAQWLARTARAYVAARPDDSHTSLDWDEAFGGFSTHPLPDGTRLGLRLADLTLTMFGAGGNAAETCPLNGRREEDARAWLGRQMAEKGLDPKILDAMAPYEIQSHTVAAGASYMVDDCAEQLRELSVWYSNAKGALERLRAHVIAGKLPAPPVRCWPHHFDLDTLVTVREGHSTGAGFSPGDEYYDEPYFYVSIYPRPEVGKLPKLPEVGHWHDKDFTAALAPASKIVKAKDQKAAVGAYLDTAVDAAIKALR